VPKSEELAGLQLRREWVLSAVFNRIERQGAKVSVDQLIKVAPLCRKPYLIASGRKAMAKAASSGDVPRLRSSLVSGDSTEKMFAASGLKAQAGEAAVDDLRIALDAAEDNNLKLHLATDLINLGDREALLSLSGLLGLESAAVRRSAIMRLRQLSGKTFSYDANATGKDLAKGAVEWAQWAKGEGLTAKLNLPVGEQPPYIGHTLAMARVSGKYVITELDTSGKEVQKVNLKRLPNGLQKLPNGNILVSFTNEILEYNQSGQEVWKLNPPSIRFSGARRLPNGNTVVGIYGKSITEYTPKGEVAKVWTSKLGPNIPIDLTGENSVMVADSRNKRVLEVLSDGSIPWELQVGANLTSASRGADGTTVIAFASRNRVEAYSRQKKLLWTLSGLSYPRYAQKLPNGNTVVLHQQGIVEVDSQGKVISRTKDRYQLIHRF
jgi:hypothetical protein